MDKPTETPLKTEFEFRLPRGYLDTHGRLQREGVMRLALARDEIESLQDPRVQENEAYLPVLLLQRVITRLGELAEITPEVIENLFASDLAYLEDLTIPDGKQVSSGEQLDKRWRVQNSGSCNWDARYQLRLIAGPSLGAKETQALYPARSGTEFELRILFVAPDQPGTYRSAWQAYDPRGQPFGDPVFVEISVPAN